MFSIKKSIILVVLLALFALAVAACQQAPATQAPTEAPAATEAVQPAEPTAVEPTQPPAAYKPEISGGVQA